MIFKLRYSKYVMQKKEVFILRCRKVVLMVYVFRGFNCEFCLVFSYRFFKNRIFEFCFVLRFVELYYFLESLLVFLMLVFFFWKFLFRFQKGCNVFVMWFCEILLLIFYGSLIIFF